MLVMIQWLSLLHWPKNEKRVLFSTISVCHSRFLWQIIFHFCAFFKADILIAFFLRRTAFKENTIIFVLTVWPEAIGSFPTPLLVAAASLANVTLCLCYNWIQRNLTQEHKYKHKKFHRVINTAYGDLDYIRIPAKEVSFNCVSLHTAPQHFSLGGRHLRKNYRNEFESKGVQFPGRDAPDKINGSG